MIKTKTISTLFLFIIFFTFQAQAKDDFVIKDFHVEIVMLSDGSFTVEETIEVFFYERSRGIFRSIPYAYTANGQRNEIKISNINSRNHRSKVSRKKGNVILKMGKSDKYLKGAQTYVINYKVSNAFMNRDTEIEFFWNLTGNEWEVPIEKMSYKLQFPDEVIISEENLRIYSGPYGSRYSEVENTIKGSSITGFSTTPIYPGSGMSVAVLIPKTVFGDTAIPLTSQRANRLNSPRPKIVDKYYPIPLFLMTLFGWLYFNTGRDPKDPVVSLQYHPPAGMGPTEVGTFYDFKVNDRDLIALIPKWGHEGLIKLSTTLAMDGAKDDIYFSKLRDLPADAPAYERSLFGGLFRESDTVFLSELKNRFYKVFSASRGLVAKDHLFSGLFNEEAKRRFHSPWLIALVALLIIGGVILTVVFQLFVTGISCVVLGFMTLVIKSQRPRLSERGLQLNRKLIGFKQFLAKPDPEELSRLVEEDPDYLQKIFPYVVAFGLDKEWNIVLENLSVDPPYWYDNDREGRTTYSDFSRSFEVREISSAFRSSPASARSGSSGMSGGSGGGFGGGGGGSW